MLTLGFQAKTRKSQKRLAKRNQDPSQERSPAIKATPHFVLDTSR